MSGVWDEIKEILSEINNKLGVAAPQRAAAAMEPRRKEINKGLDTNAITSAFRTAINDVPIFNKLYTTLSGMAPILRGLTELSLAGAGAVAIKGDLDKGSLQKELKDLEKELAKLSIFEKVCKPTGDNVLNEWQKKESEIASKKALIDSKNKDSKEPVAVFYNFINQIKTAFSKQFEVYKKIFSPQTFKNLWKDTSSLGGGKVPLVSAGMEGGGLTAAALGTLFTGLATLSAGILVVSVGLLKFAKGLVENSKAIAHLNGQMAMAFAIADIRTLFRDMQSASARAATTAKFLKAWNDLSDIARPYLDKAYNVFVWIEAEIANTLHDAINDLEWLFGEIGDVFNKIWVTLKDGGELLRDGIDYIIMGMQYAGNVLIDIANKVIDLWGGWRFENLDVKGGAGEGRFSDDNDLGGGGDFGPESKINSTIDKIKQACDAIINAYNENPNGPTPVTAAAFMAGVVSSDVGLAGQNRAFQHLAPVWDTYKQLGK